MQVNRLFEMMYLLLDKKKITARELAERFEVSVRTIYRDIEVLSSAGIPLYTNKGRGGGIFLLEEFTLNKSLLSEHEQENILMAIQSMNAVSDVDMSSVLTKLGSTFKKERVDWIDVDFSTWNHSSSGAGFETLKKAILSYHKIEFEYYSGQGKHSKRTVNPLKLFFKGQDWYLGAFCHMRTDYRFFKISRMRQLEILDDTFERNESEELFITEPNSYPVEKVNVRFRVETNQAFRIFDEYSSESIEQNEDGSIEVSAKLPKEEWLYNYLMSFGDKVKVLEPEWLKEKMIKKYEKALKNYQ